MCSLNVALGKTVTKMCDCHHSTPQTDLRECKDGHGYFIKAVGASKDK